MSWDRDEAANQQEALDRLIESQRDFTDTMREHFSRDSGDGFSPPRGGEGGAGLSGFDTQGITEFNAALKDSVGPLRVFARSIDMINEKLEETLVQARDLQQAGSFNQQQKPNPQGAASQQQLPAPPQFNTSNLLRPSAYMIPNQYGGFTMYNASASPAAAASPITTVPSQTLNPGQVRRRQARRRRLMRSYNRKKAMAKSWQNIARGAYYGGIFGGVRGAFRGAAAGILRNAAGSAGLVAAGLVGAMPFMMASTAAASERQLDANRQFAIGAPETAKALVQYDVNGFLRNLEMAKATSATAVNLIQSQDYERTQQLPFDIMTRNLSNTSASFFSNMSGRFFEASKGLWQSIDGFVTDEGTQRGVGAAGRVAGDAAFGAMIGGALGLLTIPFLGWFGPAAGAAIGSAIGGWASVAANAVTGFAPAKVLPVVGDENFLDMRFAPKVRKI